MAKKIIVVHEERCLACKTCVLECAMAHTDAKTRVEAIRSDHPPHPRVHIEPLGKFAMPLQCRHCEDAPCIAICPTNALHRVTGQGPVLLDEERCIGCKFCVLVCPFGVIEATRDGKAVVKCDLCVKRTEAGQAPACVAACLTGALTFEEVSEATRRKRRKAIEQYLAVEQE